MMVFGTPIILAAIARKQNKKALAGTPTTAIFLAAILYEQVFLYLNVNLFHYKSNPIRAFFSHYLQCFMNSLGHTQDVVVRNLLATISCIQQ